MGADVIKLESPPRGDYIRDFLGQITPHHSPAHVEVNRNKRSVLLDLRDPAALDAAWRLLATADIFVDGNTAGACDRLGIGYAAQSARKPGIVYCQYTGFGASGPYAGVPTHGEMMNALVGATPTASDADGWLAKVPDRGPYGGTTSGGEGTAAGAPHAAMAAVAALVRRDRTGEGAYIDIAGSDAVIAQAWVASTYLLNDARITDRSSMSGDRHRGAKYAFYATADGRAVLFCCIEDKFWRKFCAAVGRDDLADEDAATARENGSPVDFGRDSDDLRVELAKIFATRTVVEWMELATAQRLPLGPAYRDLEDAVDQDPHLRGRGVIQHGEHPEAGPFTYVVAPGQVAGQPWELRHPAPKLGEHTREILTGLGVTGAALEHLAPLPSVSGSTPAAGEDRVAEAYRQRP
jgi:crotonobetainyl-CoA:carnitine CoA-transferase CaiB-like acyl-CoA transferase